MRRILCFAIAFLWSSATFAQTGLEIMNRMNERINSRRDDGISVNADVKIPIVGLVTTKTTVLGEKKRVQMNVKGHDVITFDDGQTNWYYISEENSVIITNDTLTKVIRENRAKSGGSMDIDMFSDIAEGYDITIKSENLVKWVLLCKRKKGNDDDDYPKKITIEVRKETYDPILLTAKIMGMTFTMDHFKFGVTERDVTFNESDFPGVKISDQR